MFQVYKVKCTEAQIKGEEFIMWLQEVPNIWYIYSIMDQN